MQTIDNIPVYEAMMPDSDEGVLCISLVDRPAVKREFVAFDVHRPVTLCAIANEEKRRVYGVIMRANFPIYRSDSSGEYYVVFSPDIIRCTAEKYFVEGRQNNVNLMHAPGSQVEGVHMVQFFIKDTAAGIAPAGFEDIEEGSLFGEFHVTNEKIWAAIKAGEYRGFSIEGTFNFRTSQTHSTPKNTSMSKLEKFKAGLAKLLVQLGAVSTNRGPIFWDGEEDLKAGIAVFIEDEKGERKAAPDGDYMTDDGKTIKVADGKVAEISDPRAEVAAADAGFNQPAEPARDIEAVRKELDETKKRIDDIEESLEKILAALDKTNVAMRAMQKTPAAAPAHQAFSAASTVGKTGDPQIDRLIQMLDE